MSLDVPSRITDLDLERTLLSDEDLLFLPDLDLSLLRDTLRSLGLLGLLLFLLPPPFLFLESWMRSLLLSRALLLDLWSPESDLGLLLLPPLRCLDLLLNELLLLDLLRERERLEPLRLEVIIDVKAQSEISVWRVTGTEFFYF